MLQVKELEKKETYRHIYYKDRKFFNFVILLTNRMYCVNLLQKMRVLTLQVGNKNMSDGYKASKIFLMQ
jgi:hypothetical protein